ESVADIGLPGQFMLPIMTAAFGSNTSEFQNNIPLLDHGAAGDLAAYIAGNNGGIVSNPQYFCNLVGSNNFAPCVDQGISTGNGAGYPINFFQVNPFATGGQVGYLSAEGYSSYHALQVEYRQRPWHGLQYNLNYAWSHTLGLGQQGATDASFGYEYGARGNRPGFYTLRNKRLSYGPSP